VRRAALALFALIGTFAASSLATLPAPRPGDRYYAHPHSLFGLALRYHVSVDSIAQYNGIKDPANFNREGLLFPDSPATSGLPLYVPWAPATPRQTCSAQTWTLRAVKEAGCTDAYCGSGPAGERACLCREQAATDSINGRLEIASPRHPIVKLPLSIGAFNPYGRSFVDIASIDLDGDGEPETVVSWLRAVSNGLGEEWRTLVVVKSGREWIRYDSGEFTAETAAVRVAGGCSLRSSHYEEATDPLRGPALYLVERTFDPVTLHADREIVGRRCSDRGRFVLPFDPIAAGISPGSRIEHGTVGRIRRDVDGELESLDFHGTSVQRLPATDWQLRFGDASTRRLLPIGLVSQSLVARTATVERPPGGEPRVWLEK
jgi:hypothetical protein